MNTCAALLRLAPGLAALVFSGAVAALDLQGHRGARGLAPENTLAGFAAALAVGVTTLELDTVVTRDDVVVISHDPLLNPSITRDAGGRFLEGPGPAIRSLSLPELQRYDVGRLRPDSRYGQNHPEQRAADGERIPTLASLFEAVARRGDKRVRFNIETKSSPLQPALSPEPEDFVRLLLEVVDSHAVRDRISLQSFDWRTLAAARRLAPEVPRVYLSAQQSWGNQVADPRWTGGLSLAEHGSVPRMVKIAGGTIWSPFYGDLSEAALQEARALGLQVVVWTVNEHAHIERMIDLGVDGIISDRPDRVRAAMIARGLPVPSAAKID
jgi:glycerophosphoryl diester phosphodiesterase